MQSMEECSDYTYAQIFYKLSSAFEVAETPSQMWVAAVSLVLEGTQNFAACRLFRSQSLGSQCQLHSDRVHPIRWRAPNHVNNVALQAFLMHRVKQSHYGLQLVLLSSKHSLNLAEMTDLVARCISPQQCCVLARRAH